MGRLAAAICATALLAGCSSVSELFEGEPEEPTRVSVPPEAQGEQPFPNLSTVPDEAPETSTEAEREAIRQGLAADRANAEYTDQTFGDQSPGSQPLGDQPSAQPFAVPPAPAPAAPAPTGAAPAEAAPAAGSGAAAAEPATSAGGTVQSRALAAPSSQPPASQPAASQPQAPQAPQPTPQPQAAVQALESPPPAAGAADVAPPPIQSQLLANGSVTVNLGAVNGPGAPVVRRLLPSGESQPAALIFFGHGSARLARADIEVLKEVVKLHRQHGGLLRIVGHASRGAAGGDVARQNLANLNISLARANAVASELSRLGVPIDQVQVAAAGAEQPLFYETSPTGEAGNRRVEIYLDY